MLVVTIDIWPHGDRRARRRLGRIDIYNEGTGTFKRGNYGVRLYKKTNCTDDDIGVKEDILKTAKVEDYPRLSYSVWVLVYRALRELFDRKKECK